MIKDIVFHLGDCKTGSTSIQRALATKTWEAQGDSVLYPTPYFNHIYLAKSLSSDRLFRFIHFRNLRRELMKSDADHGVISAEHFEFVDPLVLRTAIEKYLPRFKDNIRLIAYVRPHCARIISQFSEHAKKGGRHPTPAAFHAHIQKGGHMNYAPRFERWREVFGDRFTLRPMIRDRLYKNDVVQDFFEFLFEGREFRLTESSLENATLSVEDIALMRECQSRFDNREQRLKGPKKAFGWNFSPFLTDIAKGGGTKPQLHSRLVEKMQKLYKDDAAQLDSTFFDGTPMSDALAQAHEDAVDIPQSFSAADYFSEREIGHAHAYADFLRRIMMADPEYFNMITLPPEKRGTRNVRAYCTFRVKRKMKRAATNAYDKLTGRGSATKNR